MSKCPFSIPTPAPTLYNVFLIPALLLTFWLLTSVLTIASFPVPNSLRGKRIVLLIAHPDDEAMFFAPSLISLTQGKLGNHLKILCLSTGDAEGLGQTRQRELVDSAKALGLRSEADVLCLDDARFKDGMKEGWREEDVMTVLRTAFTIGVGKVEKGNAGAGRAIGNEDVRATLSTSKRAGPAPTANKDKPTTSIDVLITFDGSGVSSHPNHIACHHGSVLYLKTLMRNHPGYTCPLTLYTLPTVSILRKYSFVFDALATMFLGAFHMSGGYDKGRYRSKGREERRAERVLLVSGLRDYMRARKAMVDAHKSQMVWFRWGWISLGRYMVVNELRRERVVGG